MAGKSIAFFEVEDWERDYFQKRLADYQTSFSSNPLPRDGLPEDAQILCVFIRSQVNRAALAGLPHLRMIATRSTGFEHIDVEACGERGIAVCNVPYYGENTVAEHTFALILALSRKVHKAWRRTSREDFSLENLRGFDLKSKTLGVVGAGSIGLHVIRIGRGFGMDVLVHDARENHLLAEVLNFRYLSLEELLQRADVVTLHVPALPQTHHLMNSERFRLMKPGALLINTSRGSVVDTEALMSALDQGLLGGAGLDVLEGEDLMREEQQLLRGPAAPEKLQALLRTHALVRRDNVIVTPHSAFYSTEALQRIADTTVENIHGYLEGAPRNTVGT